MSRDATTTIAAALPRRGLVRIAITALLLAAVWWPARPDAPDGFPLSSYPMFSYARGPTSTVHVVLGVQADGRRVPLTPWHVGGSATAKQSLHTVITAVGSKRSAALCREVAERVSRAPLPEPVVALEVVTEVWDTLDSRRPGAAAQRRRVHARCEVP